MEITGKKQKLRKNAFILFFLLPTLVCFCVFYLYPIATVVISSFAKWDYTNLNDMQMYSFGHLFDNYNIFLRNIRISGKDLEIPVSGHCADL